MHSLRRWIALLVVLVGCGGSENDPDARAPDVDAAVDAMVDAPIGEPRIRATLDLSSAGGGPVVCQQNHPSRGTDGIRITARMTGSTTGFSDVYPCDTPEILTPPLTTGPGSYDVWIDYFSDRNSTDAGDWIVVGTTDVTTVNVVGETAITADLVLDLGFFEANWRLVNSAGGALSCAQVPNQDGVSLLGTVTGTGTAFEDIFNCQDGVPPAPRVITFPDPLGAYVVAFSLLDSSGNSIGTAPPISTTIADGNQYRDLGVVRITVP